MTGSKVHLELWVEVIDQKDEEIHFDSWVLSIIT